MKIKFFIASTILFAILFRLDANAQKVYVADIDGVKYAAIDCRTMPKGKVYFSGDLKNMKQGLNGDSGQLMRHEEDRPAPAGGLNTANVNIKVSWKFAISPTDVNSGGEATAEDMEWHAASGYPTTNSDYVHSKSSGACYKYGGGGGTWRLPSLMELNLMYALSRYNLKTGNAAVGSSGFKTFGDDRYWSATEGNATGAWAVYFSSSGLMRSFGKTFSSRVRCVRDL